MAKIKNILSLFDGISCGQIALNKVNMTYENYYASEIDSHAIKVVQHNFPNTKQLGDVTKIKGSELPKIELLIGGSPCQSFSFIGKGLNFDDQRGRLFFEFVRLKEETNPKYFLLENVKMKKESEDVITKYLGVEPILINSNQFSAQNRKRLYWTNIPITTTIIDRGIILDDVIDHNFTDYKVPLNWDIRVPKHQPQYVDPYNRKEIKNKSTSLRTNINNGNMWVKVKDGYRNLTRTECELLQTIPVGYTDCVSDAKAKKMIGNGWTVDVIVYILNHLEL